MAFDLPRTLTLPSGLRVRVRRRTSEPTSPGSPAAGAPLWDDVVRRFDEDVVIDARQEPIDVRDLALSDFHVLRAVVTKAGILAEDEVEIDWHNCGQLLVARPCEGLETGPWEDGEAHDPELDGTAPFGEPVETLAVRVGRVRQVRDVTLARGPCARAGRSSRRSGANRSTLTRRSSWGWESEGWRDLRTPNLWQAPRRLGKQGFVSERSLLAAITVGSRAKGLRIGQGKNNEPARGITWLAGQE